MQTIAQKKQSGVPYRAMPHELKNRCKKEVRHPEKERGAGKDNSKEGKGNAGHRKKR